MGRAFEYRRASKEKRWDKMSKIFPKLSKAITIAAKEGGSDPAMNSKLRLAIQNAKAENMPKDNIDAAIKRAVGKDAETILEISYEGKGPHGVLVYIDAATDNPTRTVANVKAYFSKAHGQLVPAGQLDFMFSRKVEIQFEANPKIDLDELELEMIDAGLENFEVHEDMVYAYGDYTNFGTLTAAFEERNIELKKSGLVRLPNTPVEYTEEQMVDIEKMLDRMEDDEDVQAVYTNIA